MAFSGVYFPILILSGLAAGLILYPLLLRLVRRTSPPALIPPDDDEIAVLFKDGAAFDISPALADALTPTAECKIEWPAVYALFSGRFPDLPASYKAAMDSANLIISAAHPDDTARLELLRRGNRLRLTLTQTLNPEHLLHHHAIIQQNSTLTGQADNFLHAPQVMWTLNKDGRDVWHNEPYLSFRTDVLGIPESSPGSILVEVDEDFLAEEMPKRVSVKDNSDFGERWYEIHMRRSGNFRSFFATDITPIVKAERAQNGFVQTLTKTFAQLGAGLAIFNRDRQLILFNPALIDLTRMSAEFLSSRPSLVSFFNWLRDERIMPEPRDINEWRDKLAALTEKASDGTFSELWSMPNGLSYRVFGRPQADGAIAFLFEDVTAELSLTRNFVKELEINHSLLNQLDQALVVFTHDGDLLYVNDRFRAMWGVDYDDNVAPTKVRTAISAWSAQCASNDGWELIETVLSEPHYPRPRHGILRRKSGKPLNFTVGRLSNGASYVSFQAAATQSQEIPKQVAETG